MNRCFPCFGNPNLTDNEHDPLLPKHRARDERLPESPVKTERSVVDKIVDVLAALNAGKLPTQDQLSHFLQTLLKSEILKEDKGKVIAGNGPFSREGRKTLHDIRSLVQAFLQFGMEKNDDDKFQQLYFQVLQIDSDSAERGIHAGAHAAQRAVEETSEGAGHIKELMSIQKQVAFDAATILHAIRTLYETCLKSPSFRLALSDILSIAQDVVVHASADVGSAARHVQDAAKDVQHQAETPDDIIDRVGNISVSDAKNKGKEATDRITEAAKQATEDLKEELGDLEEKAGDKTKEKILQRMQEVISGIQKDPASRSAMRAILLLVHKYAEMIAAAAERSEDIIIDATAQVKDDSGSSYLPQPHGTAFDALFDNIKDVLQRLAQGHSLDGIVSAFGSIVRNLDAIPQVVEDEVEKILDEEPLQSPSDVDPPSPLIVEQHGPVPVKKGKGKRKKQARMREQKALEKQAKLSPAASNSQLTVSTRDETSTPKRPKHPRVFFSRLGAYLDKSLYEPGWAMSKDGASTLESLYDDGIELFSVFSEAVVDIGEEVVTEGAPSLNPSDASTELSAEEKARRQIKFDLKSLIDEIDAYTAAVKNDQTTMAILHGFDALGDDLSGLFFQSMKRGGGLSRNVVNIGSWTSWVGWAIPRLLRMLPSDAIPIPTIEVKTENVEAALNALFVQGLARGNTDSVATSLIPDEVVVKQWTEVRIEMAEHEVPYGSSTGSSDSGGKPGVQSTSRVRMHIDGVRAKIEGMGYYFKYTGGPIGYEDEGILSVDIGIGGLHKGLSADMEIEIESDNIPFEQVQIPEIVVADDCSETDTETAVATNPSSALSTAATEQPAEQSAEPFFRVVNVQVAMDDVRCRIDESRHWILNKLFLEHLAGPMVALMAKQALEEKLLAGLGVLSKGLGALLKDVKENGEIRRTKKRSDTEGGAIVTEGGQPEEGLTEKLADWWNAILNTGPMLFGRDKVEVYDEAGDGRIDVEHRTKNTVTSRGAIHSSTTVTTEQPRGAPAMVSNTLTKNLEEMNLSAIGGVPKVQKDETVIAVGSGPQLFPGKGGAYGATDHSAGRGVVNQIRDTVQNVANSAAEGLREGPGQIPQVEGCWQKKFVAEGGSVKTWKSKVFDF